MAIKLKQVGHYMGDKTGDFPNLKIGEFRYYTQDNDNIIRGQFFKDVRDFKILFEINFSDYEVIIEIENQNNIDGHYIYIIDKIIDKNKNDIQCAVSNKGYICIREASEEINGLVIGIHDGGGFIYEEKISYHT